MAQVGAGNRSVTFQDANEESEATEQEAPQAPTRSGPNAMARRFSHRVSKTFLSGRSLWRFPSMVGSMPRYMQRKFRMKTFGLMFCQLLIVLGISVGIDYLQIWRLLAPNMGSTPAQAVFYTIGALNFVSIMILQAFKDKYPVNYFLLSLTTLISGIFWGMSRGITTLTMHFQILAILAFTMLGACVLASFLSNLEVKISGSPLLTACILPPWFVGCVLDVFLASTFFDESTLQIAGAIGFSLLLLCILLVDVGRLLVRCQPDDFMSVLVSMDSTLMVVVSIPFFVLTFCFLHSGEAFETEAPTVAQLEEGRVVPDEPHTAWPQASPPMAL